jgi:hypothetical protein
VYTPQKFAGLARHAGVAWRGILAVLLIALGGCQSGPPVQEMSDARMAIAVARDAGAAQLASGDLRAAESLLDSAQRSLSQRDYSKARSDAIAAKNRALDALENAENADNADPRP